MLAFAYELRDQPVRVAGSPLPPPVLSYLMTERRWQLGADYRYPDAAGPREIVVAAGFRFDLSSIPRLLWPVIAPFELSIVAPLVHDYLDRYGGSPPAGSVTPPHHYDRSAADRLFRTIMKQEGVAAWRRTLAYAAVRSFGGGGWNESGHAVAPARAGVPRRSSRSSF